MNTQLQASLIKAINVRLFVDVIYKRFYCDFYCILRCCLVLVMQLYSYTALMAGVSQDCLYCYCGDYRDIQPNLLFRNIGGNKTL